MDNAPVAELVDAPELESGIFGYVGSKPIRSTLRNEVNLWFCGR